MMTLEGNASLNLVPRSWRRGREPQPWAIGAYRPEFRVQIAEIWRQRALFPFLARRALFGIYRQSLLGIGWMIIQPLAIAIPAAFVMGKVVGIDTSTVPLPVFILANMSLWLLFRRCMQWMTKSMQMNLVLRRRFHMPGLLLHAAAAVPAVFEFLVFWFVLAAAILFFAMGNDAYRFVLGWRLIAVVPVLFLTVMFAFGLTCCTTILNALARDTWLTLRYVLSLWMMATPIFYPLERVPEKYRFAFLLNPLTPLIELYRWAILEYGGVHWTYMIIASGLIMLTAVVGAIFFIRNEWRVIQ